MRGQTGLSRPVDPPPNPSDIAAQPSPGLSIDGLCAIALPDALESRRHMRDEMVQRAQWAGLRMQKHVARESQRSPSSITVRSQDTG